MYKKNKKIDFEQCKKIYGNFFVCFLEKKISQKKIFSPIIIVPKKKVKLAVKRNYYKRIFLASIRKISLKPQCNCYFFYNKIIFDNKKINFPALEEDLKKILQKVENFLKTKVND